MATSPIPATADVADVMARAVDALLRSRPDYIGAAALLGAIDEAELHRQRRAAAAAVRLVARSTVDRPRVSLSGQQQRLIFDADGWICRYCGRRTVAAGVCRELQRVGVWRYHLPGPPKWWHAVGYTYLASVDHVEPRVPDVSNLVTCCWQCQGVKSSRPLAGLTDAGWRLEPRQAGVAWSGLTEQLAGLRAVAPLDE